MCERVLSGVNDKVTPPDVAEEFKQLLPTHLYWIDKCGCTIEEEFNFACKPITLKRDFTKKK
jgi:hypothetical protein